MFVNQQACDAVFAPGTSGNQAPKKMPSNPPLSAGQQHVFQADMNRNKVCVRAGAVLERQPTLESLPEAPVDRQSGVTPEGGYYVSEADRQKFKIQGFVHLPAVLSDEEMKAEIDEVYERFLNGEIEVTGGDLCDMSGTQGRERDAYTVYNVMLPRTYYPQWQGNTYERRCEDIANQLQGQDMKADYDQLLAKRPQSVDAVFAWHQDMAYWPPFTSEKATATCWLAVSDATIENGCMRFVPFSHEEAEIRPHQPVATSREKSHALYTKLRDTDPISYVPIKRGDITVHNEQVIHGSGPNMSDNWRKAYVLAFRKAACVAEEREAGFTHSHNDEFNWDKWLDVYNKKVSQ